MAYPNTSHKAIISTSHHTAFIGLTLACLVTVTWLCTHIAVMFYFPWHRAWFLVPVIIAFQCWLYVGLFIIAHDCMHGSLVPGYPVLNRWIGRFILLIYAGFSFDKINKNHHNHHRHAGTADDPDFDEREPHSFFAWYIHFMTEYLSWREPVAISTIVAIYLFVLHVPIENILFFWAIPALLSSLQLFTFGTYLPHVPGDDMIDDPHRARSNDYPSWLSLLTCFHFGYHREHHLKPGAPWWRLPAIRKSLHGYVTNQSINITHH